MGAIISNALFKVDKNTIVSGSTFYLVDNTYGYIPGIQIDFPDGRKMWVINHKQGISSIEERSISYQVKEYEWSSDLGWRKVITGKFENNEMIVDDGDTINTSTGEIKPSVYNGNEIVLGPNEKTEFQYYVDTLGKNAIFPAVQNGMKSRFEDLL